MHGIKTIIWDWNGTLLNDIDICLESINMLLQERSCQQLNRKQYRDIFTFPVKKYYEKAGFDFSTETFDEIAMDFIALYHNRLSDSPLHKNAEQTLKYFRQNGYRQQIVSAMEHKSLINSIQDKGILPYFENIAGIDNHFAESKADIAQNLIHELNLNKTQVCLIGDTIHDFEVAKKTGCQCILVADGHQSAERLKKTGCIVVDNLLNTIDIFRSSSLN